ncbi:MAG: hypothetical protein ACLGIB_05235 [Actinomycetota bacterium]
MRYRKVIDEKVATSEEGTSIAGAVNAVIAANVNEPGSRTRVSRKQKIKVAQRGGHTEVHETTSESKGEGDDDREA